MSVHGGLTFLQVKSLDAVDDLGNQEVKLQAHLA